MNEVEKRIVKKLIQHLDKHGFSLCGVRDSNTDDPTITKLFPNEESKAINGIDATGDGILYFVGLDNKRRWVRIIDGNDEDCISDCGSADNGNPSHPWNHAMNIFNPTDM